MRNSTDDGINCDFCGDEVKNDFIYYSFDFKPMQKNIVWHEGKDVVLSADLCERCMELFRQRLLSVAGTTVQTATRCDVSGCDCAADSLFYKCHITKVSVDISSQPYMCSK